MALLANCLPHLRLRHRTGAAVPLHTSLESAHLSTWDARQAESVSIAVSGVSSVASGVVGAVSASMPSNASLGHFMSYLPGRDDSTVPCGTSGRDKVLGRARIPAGGWQAGRPKRRVCGRWAAAQP